MLQIDEILGSKPEPTAATAVALRALNSIVDNYRCVFNHKNLGLWVLTRL